MNPVEIDLEEVENTCLNVKTAKKIEDFHSHRRFNPNSSVDFPAGPSSGERDPAIVAKDLESHMSYLHKLKYVYLERRAKDQYARTIVSPSDETGIVNEEENQRLQLENEEKKAKLRAQKARLIAVHTAMKERAPIFQKEYELLQERTRRMKTLKEDVLNKQLELLRLQQTNPPPRLTEAGAQAKLDEQTEEMQNLMDAIENETHEAEEQKEAAKAAMAEAERLRAERVQLETQVKQMHPEGLDELAIARQYQSLTTKLDLYRQMESLQSSTAASENELRLVYVVDAAPHQTKLAVNLVFVPARQQLASVDVTATVLRPGPSGVEEEEIELDFGDVLAAKIDTNDVRGALNVIFSHLMTAPQQTLARLMPSMLHPRKQAIQPSDAAATPIIGT
ncbi:hypothetical protein EV121DRAFT_291864 [Schizophyllum commune]